ncbi:MAG: radical SAM protein [Myxococcales bacterium]|nr:radical SAM protein [Myxococcales bacterium]
MSGKHPVTPRVLIVYANPAVTASPVPPYGAERIAQAMRMAGCDARVLSPWMEPGALASFRSALSAFQPHLVAFSIRNLDDALVVRSGQGAAELDTTFYLPAVRPLVREAARRRFPVLLGGAGFSACPEGVLTYLGVEVGVVGAADDLAWRLGRALAQGTPFAAALPDDPRVVRRGVAATVASGRDTTFRPVPGLTPRDPSWLTLARRRGGRVPVALSAGCDRRCRFCVEASFVGGAVRPRPVEEVLAELRLLASAGVRRIWLAASELNVPDARHATEVLRAIAAAGLDLDVTGFLQPAPVDDALLDAFEALSVDPSTLSWEFGHLDDRLLRAGAGPTNRASIDALVERYLRRGHRTLGGSVLLGAHPLEDDASIDSAIGAASEIDRALPEGLGLAWAAGGRVYASAPLGRWVQAHLPEARPHLVGRLTPGFAAPLVYCRPGTPRALFRRVSAGLAGCRGAMQSLNAETVLAPAALEVERWVNRAILAAEAGNVPVAMRACRAALRRRPTHPEALKQLGLLQANVLGQPARAAETFGRLRAQLTGAAAAEVDEVLLRLR